MVVDLLIILALVLANGVLSGAEIAVIAVRGTQLQELVERGSRAASAVQRLRAHPERFFATVQIGITVVGATAGAVGGATLARKVAPVLARWPPIAPWAEEVALVLVVGWVSYLALVLGELVPKSLALKAPLPYALFMGRPLSWLATVARPLVWFLTLSSNVVLRPFQDRTSFSESRLTPEELAQLVDEASAAGAVHPRAGDIAARALQLPSLVASDVMVPRTRVVALRRGASREVLRRTFLEHSHSRYPVVDEDLDHVVGYVTVKDVLAMAWEESLFVLEDLVRPGFFVPSGKNAVDLLTEMRARQVPFGIVVDERGGMAGIVTLEDLLEEIVGEIFSEHVHHVPESIHREPDGAVQVLGSVTIRDLNRELELELPEGDWTTIAGLCLALAKRIPLPGERFQTDEGAVLEVLDATASRVRAVRIHPRAAASAERRPLKD